MYRDSRCEGFGREVKRRIMLGTYALSAGYRDAYYQKALKVRRLVREDFDRAFEEVDLIIGPVTPTPAFRLGERIDDPLAMYLFDLYTVSTNLAGIAGMSIPCGFSSTGLPIGLHLQSPPLCEERLLAARRCFSGRPIGTRGGRRAARPDCSPPRASCRDRDRLANDLLTDQAFLGQSTLGFEHQGDRLLEILPSFVEGRPLSVRPRQLLDKADITFRDLAKHGGEFVFLRHLSASDETRPCLKYKGQFETIPLRCNPSPHCALRPLGQLDAVEQVEAGTVGRVEGQGLSGGAGGLGRRGRPAVRPARAGSTFPPWACPASRRRKDSPRRRHIAPSATYARPVR